MTDTTPDNIGSRSAIPWIVFVLTCSLCLNGCASAPYQYGRFRPQNDESPPEIVFEYGKPQKNLDNLAWATGIWSRILAWHSKVNKHELTEETQEKLVAYLEANDLNDVLVRVNQYDPKGEWRRLRKNREVAAGWRYTIGVCTLIHYTLVPGRVFGGDYYNSFTNTLYVNSDVPAVVLHEAAYAKDIHSRRFKGTYAFVNELPLISLWRHTNGVNEILGYARANDDWAIEKETYRVVYPRIGVESTVLASAVVPLLDGLILSAAGASVGHATGQVAIYRRSKERDTMIADTLFDLGHEDEESLPDEDTQKNDRNIRITNYETPSATSTNNDSIEKPSVSDN